jgi:hypothetical protein
MNWTLSKKLSINSNRLKSGGRYDLDIAKAPLSLCSKECMVHIHEVVCPEGATSMEILAGKILHVQMNVLIVANRATGPKIARNLEKSNQRKLTM